MDSDEIFYSTTHGIVRLLEVIHRIKEFLEENPHAEYSLVIGTDSHEKMTADGKRMVNLITAVVVHRKGFGGKYFSASCHHTVNCSGVNGRWRCGNK